MTSRRRRRRRRRRYPSKHRLVFREETDDIVRTHSCKRLKNSVLIRQRHSSHLRERERERERERADFRYLAEPEVRTVSGYPVRQ